jgi:hypothetical protein
MNALQGLLLPLLLGASVGSWPDASVEELSWHPAAGTKLQREIVTSHFLTAAKQKITEGGEETISQRRLELKSVQRLKVTDVLLAVEGGRPTKLHRLYEDSSFEANIESSAGMKRTRDEKLKGAGSVVGSGVVFTWVPEDAEYGRYYDRNTGIEEVLPGLIEDLDMRELVPGREVKLSDTWELEPGVLKGVFHCGGDVVFDLAGGTGSEMLRMMRLGVGLDLDQVFGGSEEGRVTATLVAITEEEDGLRLAEVRLDFDVLLERDLKERAQAGTSLTEARMGLYVDSTVVTMKLEGSGVIRWNLDAGRLHDTVGLKASQTVGCKLVRARPGSDGPQFSSQELVMTGMLIQEVHVTDVIEPEPGAQAPGDEERQ